MTRNDASRIFAPYISEAEADGITDAIKIYPCQYVAIDTFLTLFADAAPTYDSLVAADGGVKGYKSFFDRARAEGNLA